METSKRTIFYVSFDHADINRIAHQLMLEQLETKPVSKIFNSEGYWDGGIQYRTFCFNAEHEIPFTDLRTRLWRMAEKEFVNQYGIETFKSADIDERREKESWSFIFEFEVK